MHFDLGCGKWSVNSHQSKQERTLMGAANGQENPSGRSCIEFSLEAGIGSSK